MAGGTQRLIHANYIRRHSRLLSFASSFTHLLYRSCAERLRWRVEKHASNAIKLKTSLMGRACLVGGGCRSPPGRLQRRHSCICRQLQQPLPARLLMSAAGTACRAVIAQLAGQHIAW